MSRDPPEYPVLLAELHSLEGELDSIREELLSSGDIQRRLVLQGLLVEGFARRNRLIHLMQVLARIESGETLAKSRRKRDS